MNSITTYTGIDDFINLDEFNYTKSLKIEGTLDIDDELNDLLSFSVSKEFIEYKCINTFCETNYENLNIDGNIILINNKVNLNFEYSIKNSARINIFNESLFKTTYIPIENYFNEDLDIQLFTVDLFSNILHNKKVYYAINLMVCINCR